MRRATKLDHQINNSTIQIEVDTRVALQSIWCCSTINLMKDREIYVLSSTKLQEQKTRGSWSYCWISHHID